MNSSVLPLVRDNIRDFRPYSSARDEFSGKDMVFLDANENPSDLSNKGLNRYPDPKSGALRQEIARMKEVPQSHVLIGNGSDEVLDLVFRVFCEPKKDKVMICPPTYGMYGVLAKLNNVDLVECPLTGDFQLDTVKLENVKNDMKVIFLCSPNNPTGNLLNKADIMGLLRGYQGVLVLDEAYVDFSDKPGFLGQLKDFPNLIITQTMSKAWALAGARIGIAFAQPEIIELMDAIKPPYNINQLSYEAAIDQIKNKENVDRKVNELKAEREYLKAFLVTHHAVVRVYPSDANFLLVKFTESKVVYHKLLKEGIVVRDRSNAYGCENCLRFTIGTAGENEKLKEVLNNL